MVMSSKSDESHPEILKVLPKPLHDMRRFLLYKLSPHPKNPNKTRKTPYYLSGKIRQGLMDTEADLAQLATLEECLDELMLGRYDGIGFALSGDGVGAFDLDWILDDDGNLIKAHAGYELAMKAKALGCYIEISPSGRGLRIVGQCTSTTAYSKDGLEFWGAKRFVTLTFDVWANPGGWVSLDALREPLGFEQTRQERDYDEPEEIITPKTISALKSALRAVDSDERELWIKLGLALKTIGKKGKDLWMEWSAKSVKFDEDDAHRVWETLRPTTTSHKVVFAEAQNNWGWDNPNSKKNRDRDEDPEPEDDETPEEKFEVGIGDGTLQPTEFILDGFLPVGVSVIAGAWGAGKSTNLIPLLCSAAHIAPEEWGFWPTLRRKVIWITEAPEQARDTIYSISRVKGAAPWAEMAEWFKLFRARRRPAKVLAKLLKEMVAELTYSLPNGFKVAPVMVLDTTSANLDIENESDNSQVSQAMAILKQALPGVSIVLVGHTPKALVKADVADMTFRGAGAWEADAVATYFLIHDMDTDLRYLAIRKSRFGPDYKEVNFDHESGSQIIDTPWGEAQSKSYLHGVPTKSDGSQRKAAQEEIKQERREEKIERSISERQQRVMEIVHQKMSSQFLVTKGQIYGSIGGKKELVLEAIDRLIERGALVSHQIDRSYFYDGLKGPTPEILLPAEVELALYLASLPKKSEREPVE